LISIFFLLFFLWGYLNLMFMIIEVNELTHVNSDIFLKNNFIILAIQNIVIKPGPARQVDPVARLVQVCQKIDQCNNSAKLGWPSEATYDLGEPERDPDFFSNVIFLIYPFFLYVFSWLLTLFKVYYINIRKKNYFFKGGFETL